MAFLGLFERREAQARALIDICASSVAAAYVCRVPGAPPTLVWGQRIPIMPREGEAAEAALIRALESLCASLVSEGAPALARVAGSARIDDILVSIDTPWQASGIRVEEMGDGEPFIVTRQILEQALAQARESQPVIPDVEREEHAVDIRLNGYRTRVPYGKRARRATIVVLISSIASEVKGLVGAALKRNLHASDASYISGPSLRLQVLRAAFPHERDLFVLDAIGRSIMLSLVRQGTLVSIAEADQAQAPLLAVAAVLREFAQSYPLPHTLLLLLDEADPTLSKAELEGESLAMLGLSDRPLRVLAISRAQLPPLSMGPEASVDLRLALLAQYQAV